MPVTLAKQMAEYSQSAALKHATALSNQIVMAVAKNEAIVFCQKTRFIYNGEESNDYERWYLIVPWVPCVYESDVQSGLPPIPRRPCP